MDLIKTGIGITKTIKNVARLREIVAIFARNGFDELMIKIGMHNKIPDFVIPKSRFEEALEYSSVGDWPKIIGFRLRKSFEELGPSFIKLGQLLSTREDILEPGLIEEMKKLLDQVKGIPFEEAREVIESSLGRPLESIFASIDPNPIGTASIGVVYRGKLTSGEEVVIKVRRPNIVKNIRTDFSILLFLIEKIEKVSDEIKYLGISKILKDFSHHLLVELDFHIETLNGERLRTVMAKIDEEKIFHIPKIYKEYTRQDILVMEYLDGIPFSNTKKILPEIEIVRPRLLKGVNLFIDSLLQEGFFHADLHGGNFLLLKDYTIGIIDFGLVGNLERRGRTNLLALLYFLVTYNYENLVYEFLNVAEYETIPDIEELIRDIKDGLSPFIGLTVKQTNLALLLRTVIKTLSDHKLFLPREWFIVFRALMTLDGVGKSLDIDFDIYEIIDHDVKDRFKELISKDQLIEEAIFTSRDVLSSLRAMPRHMKWYLREFSKRNYAFKIALTGHESEFLKLSSSIHFLGLCFLSGVFVISGALLVAIRGSDHYIPSLSWIFWLLGLGIFLIGFWEKWRGPRN